jgi:hypothetical protein
VGHSLNFFLHLVWWRLLFWLEAVRVTQVWLWLIRLVLESWRLGFLLPSCHLGSSEIFEKSCVIHSSVRRQKGNNNPNK